MKDFNSINNKLSQALIDRGLLPDFLSGMGFQPVGWDDPENVFRGACPVHAGDDPNFELRTEGYALPIRWRCFSRQCEKKFKPSLLGLVRRRSDRPERQAREKPRPPCSTSRTSWRAAHTCGRRLLDTGPGPDPAQAGVPEADA